MSYTHPGYSKRINPLAGPGFSVSGSAIELVSVNALGGHRVVRSEAGILRYVNQSDVNDATAVIGLTLNAVSAGGKVRIHLLGTVTESSWTWIPDQPLFVGDNGLLTQTAPSLGFSMLVGTAISADTINFDTKVPILLES